MQQIINHHQNQNQNMIHKFNIIKEIAATHFHFNHSVFEVVNPPAATHFFFDVTNKLTIATDENPTDIDHLALCSNMIHLVMDFTI